MDHDVGELFRLHEPGLFRYLVHLGGDEAQAKDAVQLAFLRLLEKQPEVENVKAWLYRVATNQVREWSRTEARRRELGEAKGPERAMGDPPPDPEQTLDRTEAQRRLARVLGRLSERDRMLLLMREEGFTHREMAAAAGTTTGSVGTLLARALEKAGRLAEEEAA